MAIPASWAQIPIIGTFRHSDGAIAAGRVRFLANQVVVCEGEIVYPERFTAVLDANGEISISIPATDDPDINPTGWVYYVVEDIIGKSPRVYTIAVPYDGGTIDLADVIPVDVEEIDNLPAAVAAAIADLFGTSEGEICEGNDTRLSDARTPTSHASSHQSGGGDALSGLVSAQMPKWSQGTAISATTHNAATADAGYMRPCTDGSGCAITFHSDNIVAGDCGAYRADSGGGALTWAAGGTMTVVPLTSGATSTQAAPAVLCWLCISSTLCYVWGQIE